MSASEPIVHDPTARRFTVETGTGQAFLEYRVIREGVLEYRSTYVPEASRGRGIGERLVQHALDYAKDRGYRVVPSCPFVRALIERHPSPL